MYHKTKEERKSQWDWKGIPCRFLGYDESGKDSYVILDIISRSVKTRKSVVFGKSLVDLSIPAPGKDDYGGEDRNDYDILLEDPYGDSMDGTTDKSDSDENNDDEITGLDYHDDLVIEDDEDFDNRRVDSELEEFPYWAPEEVTGDRNGYEKNNESEGETDTESIMLTQLLLSEWIMEVHEFKAPQPLPENPKSVEDALSGPYHDLWKKAICDELQQFEDRNIFGPAEQTGLRK